MPNRSSSQQIQRPQWDNQRTIQLIRLVKAHYSVPHQEQPGLDKCQQPVDLHKTQDLVDSKVQDLVDLHKTQDLVDSKVQDLVDLHKTQDLVDSKVQDLVDSKVLPLQQVKVVHRQHRHSIHSSDSLHKHVVMTQLMDRQEALDQIMAPPPQLVAAQVAAVAAAPQLVTQVHSDEASLTLQPRRLMARRVQQQIMLMEAPLKHLRYSVVSLPLHQQMADSRDQELADKVQLVDSRDQAHLMVLLQ
jgi:hypothetical protein